MEEEMKELYAEGPATHGGPEPCVDDPRGRGEALVGARAGRAIEPRNEGSWVRTPCRGRKAKLSAGRSRAVGGPRAVGEPWHVVRRDKPARRTRWKSSTLKG